MICCDILRNIIGRKFRQSSLYLAFKGPCTTFITTEVETPFIPTYVSSSANMATPLPPQLANSMGFVYHISSLLYHHIYVYRLSCKS